MRQTFNAGADLDILTKAELRSALKEWMVDVAKGIRPIRISAQVAAAADGTVTMGGPYTLTGGQLGPEPGFCWAVTRLAVRVDSIPAAYSIYLNDARTHTLVRDVNGDANGYASFGPHELILTSSDVLVVRTSSVTGGSTVTASGQAAEIPQQLLWKWMAG